MIIPISTASTAEKHLDQLQELSNAATVTAILIILADASADKDVTFLGFKVDTSSAYGIAALALIMLYLFSLQALARLAATVDLAEGDEGAKVLGSLFAHRWPLNPFAYSGTRMGLYTYTSFGMPLLVFNWWLGLIALALLWNRMSLGAAIGDRIAWAAYIGVGLLSMILLVGVQQAVRRRLSDLVAEINRDELRAMQSMVGRGFGYRNILGVVAAGIGYAAYYMFTHIGA